MPSIKMKVDGVNQFVQAMNQSKNAVKTLDSELKLADAQFKSTGDKQEYTAKKSEILRKQIDEQKKVVEQASKALEAMQKKGIDPSSASFQKMQQQLNTAKTALVGMENNLNHVGDAANSAAKSAEGLTTAVNSINTKVSFGIVTEGLSKLSSGFDKVAQKATQIATALWDNMMQAARWADDTGTLAEMYGITPEELQRMQWASNTYETSTETILQAWNRLQAAAGGNKADEVYDLLYGVRSKVGRMLAPNETFKQYGTIEDMFWGIADAVKGMSDAAKASTLKEIFGTSYAKLIPIFNAGREAWEAAKETATPVTDADVDRLTKLNQQVNLLQERFESTKTSLLANFAEPLTKVAAALDAVLAEINTYLQTDEGQAMMQTLGEAFSNMVGAFLGGDISTPVEAFKTLMTKLADFMNSVNPEGIKSVFETLAGFFIGVKGLSLGADVLKFFDAAKGLFGGKGGGAVPAEAGGGVVSAVGGKVKDFAKIGLPVLGEVASVFAPLAAMYAVGNYFDKLLDESGEKFEKDIQQKIAAGEDVNLIDKYMFLNYQNNGDLPSGPFGNLNDWVETPVDLVVTEESIEQVEEQLASARVILPVYISTVGGGDAFGSYDNLLRRPKANGISSVPYDGYMAVLHRGERIMTARENASYTANSNLYVENMNMCGGMDAQALSAAMAAQNRRTRAGFGG